MILRLFVLIAALAVGITTHAQNDEALTALVQVLGENDDVQFQLDVLRGMSEGLKGRRGVKMPQGWMRSRPNSAKAPTGKCANSPNRCH
jgi:hypothetical protein